MCYFDLWFELPAEHTFIKQSYELVCCYNFLFCHIKLESNFRKVIYTALISFWHISANKNCQLLANNMKQKDILTIILLLYSFKNMFRYENNTKGNLVFCGIHNILDEEREMICLGLKKKTWNSWYLLSY